MSTGATVSPGKGPYPWRGDVPVLFLVFNRPAVTREVFAAIRHAAPARLYVASDGPRNKEEQALVESVRGSVIQSVDWPCEVSTLFREQNLGCREAVSGAISWFFENEEAGIILEDDCLPHPAFFGYCAHHLKALRNDPGVATINGSRFHCYDGLPENAGGQLSRVFHCWGWAGWRRSWELYSNDPVDSRMILDQCRRGAERRYWEAVLREAHSGRVDTWDYAFNLQCFARLKRHLLPSHNLVLNRGFAAAGTHAGHRPAIVPDSLEELADDALAGEVIDDPETDMAYYATQFRSLPVRLWNRLKFAAGRMRP
jgi:hypothetical protein